MKALILLGILCVSILHAGAFQVAWGAEAQKESVVEKKYANAGFIVPDAVPTGTVIKLFEQKLGSTGPDEVFVDLGKRDRVKKGDRFTVYTLDRYIYHPVLPGQGTTQLNEYSRRQGFVSKDIMSHPGKPLGHRVMIHGVLEITEPGDEVSYARVVKAYESIEPGYLLTPYNKLVPPVSKSSQDDKPMDGYIVATKGDKIGIMTSDIVYIDKGWEDRVRPGDHFQVYSVPFVEKKIWNKLKSEKTPLLPFAMGELKVIATQRNTSTAVVVKSKIDMKVGNPIRFKPSNHPG